MNALTQGGRSGPTWATITYWLIAGFTLLRLVMAAVTPLTPHEAYYWTWSRFPDWSYFDHPPLASYGIGLSTLLFGSTAFGIKASAVAWSLGWNLLWTRVIQDMYGDERLTFWSLLALNLTLLYELYGFGPTPDGPMLFGWVGAVWAVWRAASTGQGRWWYLAGLFIGIACLGKYTAALLVPAVGMWLVLVPAQRHWLARHEPWLALVLAAIVFSPVVLWNAEHGWASLAFQSTRRVGEMGQFKPRFFVVLLVTQLLMLTPYVFIVSLAGLWRALRDWAARRIEPHELLLLLTALVPLAIVVVSSLRTNAKINWLMPAWWALTVLGMRQALRLGAAGYRRRIGVGHRVGEGLRLGGWHGVGIASSSLILAGAAAIALVPNLPLPGDLNIWSGWRPAAEAVDRLVAGERAQGRKAFVFAPNHKISSLIWFYRAGQERTYAQDIIGRRALQFDFFPRTEPLQGASGVLVVSDQAQSALDLGAVRPYFDSVTLAQVVEAGAMGRSTRRIHIYLCRGYRGAAAPASDAAIEE